MKEKITVLIADDNMEFATTLKKYFDQKENMEVVAIAKDGNEAFEKVKEILKSVGIDVNNEDGSVKDLYTVICEVAEVWNKEK